MIAACAAPGGFALVGLPRFWLFLLATCRAWLGYALERASGGALALGERAAPCGGRGALACARRAVPQRGGHRVGRCNPLSISGQAGVCAHGHGIRADLKATSVWAAQRALQTSRRHPGGPARAGRAIVSIWKPQGRVRLSRILRDRPADVRGAATRGMSRRA